MQHAWCMIMQSQAGAHIRAVHVCWKQTLQGLQFKQKEILLLLALIWSETSDRYAALRGLSLSDTHNWGHNEANVWDPSPSSQQHASQHQHQHLQGQHNSSSGSSGSSSGSSSSSGSINHCWFAAQ